MEVNLNGQQIQKKEIKYGKQDIMFIIQLKHKVIMLEYMQQMYVCRFLILLNVLNLQKMNLQGTGLKAPMVGHVGDGNFHVTIVYDPNKENEYIYILEISVIN